MAVRDPARRRRHSPPGGRCVLVEGMSPSHPLAGGPAMALTLGNMRQALTPDRGLLRQWSADDLEPEVTLEQTGEVLRLLGERRVGACPLTAPGDGEGVALAGPGS